jgi:solute:Na+ symporter, SSS family
MTELTPALILGCFLAYSLLIFAITWFTSRNATNESYFVGNKSSRWYIVAYGMIGASLSGVTFMSVPGNVRSSGFSYMMIVLGYFTGYLVIARILLPLYYRLNLTSIYSYLEERFGFFSYKTGAAFFILSRSLGAGLRMFLVVNVLQDFVFSNWGIPFWITALGFIILIVLYTYEGGIKTIVWTDTLQTTFMLLGVILSVVSICNELNIGFGDLFQKIRAGGNSQMVFTDWSDRKHFIKLFLSGMFVTITMTGLDQEMMQKNLSCRNIGEAQKNMFSFSMVLIISNLLFLILGAVLYLYATEKGISIPTNTDRLFPEIAIKHLGVFAGLVFIVGLISAAYPSADGALTSLTTSVCIDFLGFKKNNDRSNEQKEKLRKLVHLCFAFLFLCIIVIIRKWFNNDSIITNLLTAAGYTYGPLLGLYAFGLFTRRSVKDKFVPIVCIISPVVCYLLNTYSVEWLRGYKFGFELLLLNGALTLGGLFCLSKRAIS